MCEDASRAPSMLAFEINAHETAVMLVVFRDGWISIFGFKVEYVFKCFFVTVDAPQSREKIEPTKL